MAKRALLVIDMDRANGWSPESIYYGNTHAQVARSLQDYLRMWRKKNEGLTVFVMFPGTTAEEREMFAGYEAQKKIGRGTIRCIGCEAPHEKRLASFLEHRHEPFEPVFVKFGYGAFGNKRLAPFLKYHGVEEVVLAGCATDECVECTAAGALSAGFHITLLGDCVHYPIRSPEEGWEWVRFLRAVEKPPPHLNIQVV